ncbi:MAG TPA: SpoIIE family protein phosphatase [Thermoanaerobaculia bacterium]|nr:SpoIIE family protein phosphatase [Thermoanaerobaculia bacterium]
MTTAPSRTGTGLRAELDRLAGEVLPSGRPALQRLLPLFAAANGGGAAIYLATERGLLRREALAGEGDFPEELAQPPASALAFEGGWLAWSPAVAAGELTPESLALALAVAAAAREVRLSNRLRRQDFEAKTRGVQLEALYDVGLAIASTLDFDRLCEEILMRAVSLLDARRGALYVRDGALMRLQEVFGGPAEAAIDPDSPEGRELLSGTPSPSCCALPGTSHLLGVPIAIDGAARGILVVGDKESRRGVGPFPEEDRRTLELLANQAAIALENADLHRQALEKERLEREIELASEIQKRILPKGVPDLPGWELVGWNRPARHVGGDYYDLFPIEVDGRTALVVGDVSGKGVPAALLVSTLHSSLRLLIERLGVSDGLLERLNRHVLDSSAPNKFITLFLGSLDVATGALDFLNAGHNPGLLVRADGTVVELGPGGLPIGLMPGATYRSESLALGPGDLLCLYTDGITEAASPEDEEFGLERLASLLGVERRRPLAEVRQAIDDAVTGFAAGEPQADDQTLILLRRRP